MELYQDAAKLEICSFIAVYAKCKFNVTPEDKGSEGFVAWINKVYSSYLKGYSIVIENSS